MDIRIDVEGIPEVEKLLEGIPDALVNRAYIQGLEDAAYEIASKMKIPVKAEDVGGYLDKGELARSLRIGVELDSKNRGGIAGIGFGKNTFVARFVEFGHILRGHGRSRASRKLLGNVPPHPFMRPAVEAGAGDAMNAFARAIERVVREQYPGK